MVAALITALAALVAAIASTALIVVLTAAALMVALAAAASRVHLSSIYRLFLSSLQQTLLPERRLKETHENAQTHKPVPTALVSAKAEESVHDLHSDSPSCSPDLPAILPEEPPPKNHREMHLCYICDKALSSKSHLKRHEETIQRQSAGQLCLSTVPLTLLPKRPPQYSSHLSRKHARRASTTNPIFENT